MPAILASGTGYPTQNLDDDVFQIVFDELQAIKLPLAEGSLGKLVNLLQPVHQRSFEQQVRFFFVSHLGNEFGTHFIRNRLICIAGFTH
jgi:hypothetical protein